jgi:hypothetical protein
VKLGPGGAVLDFFTPHDQATLDFGDLDLGSGGLMLLPDQRSAVRRLLIAGGKGGTVYLVNRDAMGRFRNNDRQIVQSLVNAFPGGTADTGNYSTPVYFDGTVYFSAVGDAIKAFRLSHGLLSIGPTSQSQEVYARRGGSLAISANGSQAGILWAVQDRGDSVPGVLRAYRATNLDNELYNSDAAGPRDTLDAAAKFSVPLVVNGKVFVGSMSRLTVYGLLP